MNQVVIGLGFGDEGKGLTTDYLCSLSPNAIVARFSGGQQAGHTVVLKDKRHVFSNFGSGTMRGAPTYWLKECTIDPVGILNELEILKSKGFNPKLYIHKDCPVTTPFDKYANQHNKENLSHGTCGVGINETWKRERNNYHLTFADLYHPSVLKMKVEEIGKYHETLSVIYHHDFFDFCRIVISNENVKMFSTDWIPSSLSLNLNLILEGSQGLLLDKDIGFFPYVTPSNTGTKNITQFLPAEIFLVTRAYQTRHGNGPMTNESKEHNIVLSQNETNVSNTYQGNFKVSILDLDLLVYGLDKDENIKNNSRNNLVVTCLDNIKGMYKFTYGGKLFKYAERSNFLEDIFRSLKEHIPLQKLYYSESPNEVKELKI